MWHHKKNMTYDMTGCRLVMGLAVCLMAPAYAGIPARSRQPEKLLQKLLDQVERRRRMGQLNQLLLV